MKRHPRSIRSTLIEPFKQLKMGLWVMLITLTFIVVLGYLIANGLADQYQQVIEIFNVVRPDQKWSLIQNDIVMAIVFKISAVVIVFLSILFGVIISLTHRFYGPMIAIERMIKELIAGDYSARIAIRKRDELQHIASLLNQMAETLQERHRSGQGERRSESPRGRRGDDGESEAKLDEKGQDNDAS